MRTINIIKGCLVAILALAAALNVCGAPVVRDIEVLAEDGVTFDPGFVLAHTKVKRGKEFNSTVISGDVRRLLDTGRFSTVDAGIEKLPDGVKVVFRVDPKMMLADEPEYTGVERFRKRKIRKLLDLKRGALVDDQTVAIAVNKVLDEYRKKSYPDADCTWELEKDRLQPGVAKLTLHFEEGDESYIRDIEVFGNDSISYADLRKALEKPSPFNPIRWFKKKRYQKYQITAIEEGVKLVYMNHGFLDVKVSGDVVVKEQEPGRKIYTALINVAEGAVYHIDNVTVEGITKFPRQTLLQLVTLKTGDIASLNAIKATADRLQAYYGDRGYMNTTVKFLLTPKTGNTVDVKYTIKVGELVKIRNIIIRGNTRTKDKVIRRELLVDPGETYNQTRVQRSKRRVKNLGFFSDVRVVPQKTNSPGLDDLVFDVTEKRTGQFMVGAGFSSVDHLMGYIELSQANFDLLGWPHFTGAGQKLRLRAQLGSTRKDYDLAFTEPWLFDRKLAFNFNLYSHNRNYRDYDVETRGTSIGLGKALPGANRINLRYSLEDSKITDVSDTNTYYVLDSYDFETDSGTPYHFEEDQRNTRSTLTLSLLHDTRDHPFVPTHGNKVRLFYGYSGGPLGFDTEMQNMGLKTHSYLPLWFGHVISLKTRFQFIEPMGDADEIPLANKLFLGGGRTLRGFDYREVGPKVIRKLDDGTYYARAYGGQSLFMASVEYTIPIVRGVRLAAFYDTGNVWEDTYKVDFGDLASSYGFGIRLDMPGFPIRIDRAFVIDYDDDYTGDDKWVIWIGYDN